MLCRRKNNRKYQLLDEPPLWLYWAIKTVCKTLHVQTKEEREILLSEKRRNDLCALLAIRGNLDAISAKSTPEK